MKRDAEKPRTPMLNRCSITHIHRPDQPEIERWIDRDNQTIYINTGAKPGAKITALGQPPRRPWWTK